MANHELRTPLTSILGYAELLQLQASSSDGGSFGQEAIDHILQEGEALFLWSFLLMLVLATSRLESKEKTAQISNFTSGGLLRADTFSSESRSRV
jgi:signal transduction histidine kinase